jgi:hypothetical protein
MTKKERDQQQRELARRIMREAWQKVFADLPPIDMSNPEDREAAEYYRAAIERARARNHRCSRTSGIVVDLT